MKSTYKIVSTAYVVTLLLYLTFYLGLLAQFVLGCMHLLTALEMFIDRRQFNYSIRKNLRIYGLLVLGYFLILFLSQIFPVRIPGNLEIIYLTFIPMSIGAFFVYITWTAKNAEEDNQKKDAKK